VYVAYPFCAQKCTFCNFASGPFPRGRYVETLAAEIAAHRWEWTPETVYIGGGTPSLMDPAELGRVLDLIPGRPWAEATIEAAPGSITAEKAHAWAAGGINRASLGVQTFVESEIRRTGRKHTAATVARDIETLAAAGIVNLNIDLIAGLEKQTRAGWDESLAWIERLAPPHVSVYMFEIDENSRLGRRMLANGESGDLAADLYETAVDRLAAMGIPRYEISNFARPGMESRHNLKYWRREPYVGFGADAHSFDGRRRWSSAESAPADEAAERFFVGLRLMEGIRPTPEEWRRFDAPIRRFVEAGLLETAGGALRLTRRGVLVSNEVFQEFVTLS
jgi:oxygen-independent coproporphyrinogen-3 oxidase